MTLAELDPRSPDEGRRHRSRWLGGGYHRVTVGRGEPPEYLETHRYLVAGDDALVRVEGDERLGFEAAWAPGAHEWLPGWLAGRGGVRGPVWAEATRRWREAIDAGDQIDVSLGPGRSIVLLRRDQRLGGELCVIDGAGARTRELPVLGPSVVWADDETIWVQLFDGLTEFHPRTLGSVSFEESLIMASRWPVDQSDKGMSRRWLTLAAPEGLATFDRDARRIYRPDQGKGIAIAPDERRFALLNLYPEPAIALWAPGGPEHWRPLDVTPPEAPPPGLDGALARWRERWGAGAPAHPAFGPHEKGTPTTIAWDGDALVVGFEEGWVSRVPAASFEI
ncbi:MAG TPA: hypothetical protein VFS43_13510 [Polyangiaceae bacterium]|nr:hypothetical protein [Polyangiaceae bacterium]